MMEYAAFGFVALEWWTWPLVFAVVMSAVWGGYRLENILQDRKIDRSGPHPCLVHLGTELDGKEWWCWLKEGHAGPHHNEWMVAEDEIRDVRDMAPGPDPELSAEANGLIPSECRTAGCVHNAGHPGLCSPMPRS